LLQERSFSYNFTTKLIILSFLTDIIDVYISPSGGGQGGGYISLECEM
jgi:hypothetical protein